jgi:hypothetical protein
MVENVRLDISFRGFALLKSETRLAEVLMKENVNARVE